MFALRESRRGAWRQALGGSEVGRLGSSEAPYVGLGMFLDAFVGFLRTSNTYVYDELNMIEHTWTTDYWEERCDLVSPLGLIVAAWGVLGGSGSL